MGGYIPQSDKGLIKALKLLLKKKNKLKIKFVMKNDITLMSEGKSVYD